MRKTPSGVDYYAIPGRYMKGTAGSMRGEFLEKIPAHAPLVVVCPYDLPTEIKLRLAFDMVEVDDGWIKAYTDRGSIGVNEYRRFVVRAEKSPDSKPEFIPMESIQSLFIFKPKEFKPEHRQEFQAIAGAL